MYLQISCTIHSVHGIFLLEITDHYQILVKFGDLSGQNISIDLNLKLAIMLTIMYKQIKMLALIQIISVTTYSLSIAIVNLLSYQRKINIFYKTAKAVDF